MKMIEELSNELKYVFGDVQCFILSPSCYDVSTLPWVTTGRRSEPQKAAKRTFFSVMPDS